MRWTEEQDAIVREMAAKSDTASEISAAIGCGVSRAAVIGRMRRKGIRSLNSAATRSKRSRLARAQESPLMVTPDQTAEPIAPPPPKAVTPQPERAPGVNALLCLQQNGCRFPLWGPNDLSENWLFCGQPKDHGPYCLPHFQLTHMPAAPRRRAA